MKAAKPHLLPERKASWRDFDSADTDSEIALNHDQFNDLVNIATGVYYPLRGFATEAEFDSILAKMRLPGGEIWSIPVILPVNKSVATTMKKGSQVLLTHSGEKVGVLIVADSYKFDKIKYARSIYTTEDKKHPGVAMINSWDDYLLGGEIFLLNTPKLDYPDYTKTPNQTREYFHEQGWKTIVGFQTRNPAHIAHEFIQKLCLEFVDALFVNPIIGKKKSGDFKDEVILAVYDNLVNTYYPKDSSLIAIYKSRMYYAGPKEAVMHALVRRNFGCTHFIVGRDHAGVGNYYDKYAAHEIFEKLPDIEIEIMRVSAAFFCRRCNIFTTAKICPHNDIYHVSPSGTQVRQFIQDKNYEGLRRVMRDESLDIIFNFDEPFVV